MLTEPPPEATALMALANGAAPCANDDTADAASLIGSENMRTPVTFIVLLPI
jgi:hypothetical protein